MRGEGQVIVHGDLKVNECEINELILDPDIKVNHLG